MVMVILEPPTVLLGRGLFDRRVVVFPFPHPLHGGRWTIVTFPCGSFRGHKRCSWGWRAGGDPTRLAGVGVVLVVLVRIPGIGRRRPIVKDRSDLGRRAITPSIRRHWTRAAVGDASRWRVRHASAWRSVIGVHDTIWWWLLLCLLWLRWYRLWEGLWWRIDLR